MPTESASSDPLESLGALRASLESALLRELQAAWRDINATHFQERMALPVMTLSEGRHRLGQWESETRNLSISRNIAFKQPWGIVLEVLKHEMAHQYVDEVIGDRNETAHGPAFRSVCKRLGIDSTANGMPNTHAPSDPEQRIIERIARLLALAESANEHESHAAAAAAQKLMLKYNLESVRSGASNAYQFRHLGEPSGRVQESDRVLSHILSAYFFVEVLWVPVYRPLEGKRGSVLEVCGTQANLAMAEYVHSFLSKTSESLWTEHKRAMAIRSDRDRRTYMAGVMSGFAEKLRDQASSMGREGLVWIKDADLSTYLRQRYPHIRSVRYGGGRKNKAYTEGKDAGRRIVLRKSIETGPATSRGRLLKS